MFFGMRGANVDIYEEGLKKKNLMALLYMINSICSSAVCTEVIELIYIKINTNN